jgi:hypothetical protein
MKRKTKLLVVVVFCVMSVGLLQAVAAPLPNGGQRSICLGSAKAQGCSYQSCDECLWSGYAEDCRAACCDDCELCLWENNDWDYCVERGVCGTSARPAAEKEPTPQPPDQVDAGQGRHRVYYPPEPDIWFDFPPGAVSVPIEVRAYRTRLPAGVPPPAGGTVVAPFYFGAWTRGEGRTVGEFHQPIVIHVRYRESDLAQIPGALPINSIHLGLSTSLPLAMVLHPTIASLLPHTTPPSGFGPFLSSTQEERLQLRMYDPHTGAWVKLCCQVDAHTDVVSGAILAPKPLEEGGNALFAVILDNTPGLEQTVNAQGKTTLSIPGGNFRLGVLAGTVEVDTYFVITPLPDVPQSQRFKLLPSPVDIKACFADEEIVTQITEFPKPMQVEFEVDASTLSRAGGWANLTIFRLQDHEWNDLDESSRWGVVRGDAAVAADTSQLGTFSLGVR